MLIGVTRWVDFKYNHSIYISSYNKFATYPIRYLIILLPFTAGEPGSEATAAASRTPPTT